MAVPPSDELHAKRRGPTSLLTSAIRDGRSPGAPSPLESDGGTAGNDGFVREYVRNALENGPGGSLGAEYSRLITDLR